MKTNKEFITELVDEAEYYDYVDFIDKYQSTFDKTKQMIHFVDFIKQQGRNKDVKLVFLQENSTHDELETITESLNNEDNAKTNILGRTEIIDGQQSINANFEHNIKKESIQDEKICEINLSSNVEQQKKDELNKLTKANQNLVKEAATDIDKLFEVGQFLIEGKNGFPINIKLGLKFIEESVKHNCTNAQFYYIKLLIKGTIIPEDLPKANEYLIKVNNLKDNRQYWFQGVMSIKKKRFTEAVKFFEQGSKLGNLACMYKNRKMLFIGEGI